MTRYLSILTDLLEDKGYSVLEGERSDDGWLMTVGYRGCEANLWIGPEPIPSTVGMVADVIMRQLQCAYEQGRGMRN